MLLTWQDKWMNSMCEMLEEEAKRLQIHQYHSEHPKGHYFNAIKEISLYYT